MSQNQNQDRISALDPSQAKTPAERAKQIQELQRLQDLQAQAPVRPSQPNQQAQQAQQAPQSQQTQAGFRTNEVFDPKAVAQVNQLKGSQNAALDQAAYGANQIDEAGLFGSRGTEIQVTGNPWKIIPFGPPPAAVAPALDLKAPAERFTMQVPENAVKVKQGNLFAVTLTPADGGAPIKRAVLTDDRGNFKAAEFKTKESLRSAMEGIPTFLASLFNSAFNEGHIPTDRQRIVSVEAGKGTTYSVTLERKSEVDGKWKSATLGLNNFGLKVPDSNDPRRHDLVVAMYYLDRFNAG